MLPNFALVRRVHVRPDRALEVRREIRLVLERSDDPVPAGRMVAGQQAVPERFGPVNGTPDVRGADPEHLLRRILVQAGQPGLRGRAGRRPPAVRVVREHHAAVVRDVLAHRVQPVDAHTGHLDHGEVAVLPEYAVGPFRVLGAGLTTPPSAHVARLVIQSALVVEAVRDLVADHVADAAVVHIARPVAGKEHALQYACNDENVARDITGYCGYNNTVVAIIVKLIKKNKIKKRLNVFNVFRWRFHYLIF